MAEDNKELTTSEAERNQQAGNQARDQNEAASKSTGTSSAGKPWGIELKAFCMLMHLSQLTSFIIPGAGIVLPIIMWATNKDEYPEVDLHGLIIFNWMISALIYFIGCLILFVIFIGIPLMFILGLVALIFTVIGAIKANEGQYWPYPLSIDFFSVKQRLPNTSGE